MSKSSESDKGSILMLDDENTIRKKIMSATTDSEMSIRYNPEEKPGISNLITLYSVIREKDVKEVEEEFKDSNYGEFKKAVADAVVELILPIQERYNKILNSDIIDKILDEGAEKSSKIAKIKYEELKNIVGLHK